MKFVDFDIFNGKIADIYPVTGAEYISTINAHAYVVSLGDKLFRDALVNSKAIFPDGISISWAHLLLKRRWIKKIAGYDVMLGLLEVANKEKLRVCFYGSTRTTLGKIEKRISLEYPNIELSLCDPGIRKEASQFIDAELIGLAELNDIIFIGLTAPKQEKVAFLLTEKIKAVQILAVPVGAAFDFYAGTVKRSGKIWRLLGLEFLPRLLREPKRLWKRTFISGPRFLWSILSQLR